MDRTGIIALVALVGLFTAQAAMADPVWTTIDAPDATATLINAIDGNNLVGYYVPEGGPTTGFLYNGGTWTSIVYPGIGTSSVNGISGNTMVGTFGPSYSSFIYNGSTWSTLTAPGSFITEAVLSKEAISSGAIIIITITAMGSSTTGRHRRGRP